MGLGDVCDCDGTTKAGLAGELLLPVASASSERSCESSPSTGTEHSESMLLAGRIVAFSTKNKRKKNIPDQCIWRGSVQNKSQAVRM